jgi:hypothetical protein
MENGSSKNLNEINMNSLQNLDSIHINFEGGNENTEIENISNNYKDFNLNNFSHNLKGGSNNTNPDAQAILEKEGPEDISSENVPLDNGSENDLDSDSENVPLDSDSENELLDIPLDKDIEEDEKTEKINKHTSEDELDELQNQLNRSNIDEESLDSEIDENYIGYENIIPGDSIKIICNNEGNIYNNDTGLVIHKSDDILLYKKDDDSRIRIEIDKNIPNQKYGIKNIEIINKIKSEDYLQYKNIKKGSRIKLITQGQDPLSEKIVEIISIISKKITVSLVDRSLNISDFDIDLSNGIPIDTNILDIELVDQIEESQKKVEGIEFINEDLEELLDIEEIPDNEKLYTEKEEYNDLFDTILINLGYDNINEKIENNIHNKVQSLVFLKDSKTKYNGDLIEGIMKKGLNYKKTMEYIINNQFDKVDLIPISKEIRKTYTTYDIDGIEEGEDIYLVNQSKELNMQQRVYSGYLDHYSTISENNYENMIYKNGKIDVTYKSDINIGHTVNIENDTIVFNNEDFVDNENDLVKKNLYRKSLGKSKRYYEKENPFTNEIEEKETVILNGEDIQVVGFISFPEKYKFKNCGNLSLKKKINLSRKKIEYIRDIYKNYHDTEDYSIEHITGEVNNGEDVIITFSYDSEDHEIEGNIIRKDEKIYYILPHDEELQQLTENRIWEINIDSVKNVIYKNFLKKGDKVKICFINEGENFTLKGIIQKVEEGYFDKTNENAKIKILPEDKDFGEILEFDNSVEIVKINDEEMKTCQQNIDRNLVLYLFGNDNTDKEKYLNLCDKILPNFDQILKRKKNINKYIYNFTDFNLVYGRYNVDIDDLVYTKFDKVRNIINDNIEEYKNNRSSDFNKYRNLILNYHDQIKELKKENKKISPVLIDNVNIEKMIKKYYDVYPYLYLNSDILVQRLKWLFSFEEKGHLFFKVKELSSNRLFSSSDENQIIITQTEKTIEEIKLLIQKNKDEYSEIIESEKKMITSCDQLKFSKIYMNHKDIIKDNIVKDLYYDKTLDDTPFNIKTDIIKNKSNITAAELLVEIKKKLDNQYPLLNTEETASNILENGKRVKIGDYALLKNENKVFVREKIGDGSVIWNLSDIQHIRDNTDFCNQQGKNMDQLTIKDLQKEEACVISKDEICLPKKIERIKQKIENNKNKLVYYQNILDNLINKGNCKELLENDVLRCSLKLSKIKENIKNSNSIKEKKMDIIKSGLGLTNKSKDRSLKILNNIMNIHDPVTRNNKLDDFINSSYVREPHMEEEENWLYSNISNVKLISKHWILKIQLTKFPENYQKNMDKLIKEYGVITRGSKYIISKIDGNIIKEIEDETFEGFDSETGKAIMKDIIQEQLMNKSDIVSKFNYPEGTDEKNIFDILDKISTALYIYLKDSDIEEIVADTKIFINLNNVKEEIWILNEKQKRFTISNSSKDKKKKIDQNKYNKDTEYKKKKDSILVKDYRNYYYQLIITFTISRLIICIQTADPAYKFDDIFEGCVFSLDGYPLNEYNPKEEYTIINYFTCVLDKIKKGSGIWNAISKWKKEKIAKYIKKWIDLWIEKFSKIRDLYHVKTIELEKNKTTHKNSNLLSKNWIFFKPSLYKTNIQKEPSIIDYKLFVASYLRFCIKKDHKNINKLQKEISYRKNWLSKYYIAQLNSIFETKNPEYFNASKNPTKGNICCYKLINENNNYNTFISDKKSIFEKIKEELRQIEYIEKTFIYKSSSPLHLINNNVNYINSDIFFSNTLDDKTKKLLILKYSIEENNFAKIRLYNSYGIDTVSGTKSPAFLPNLSTEERINLIAKKSPSSSKSEEESIMIRLIHEIKKNSIISVEKNKEDLLITKNITDLQEFMNSKLNYAGENRHTKYNDAIEKTIELIKKDDQPIQEIILKEKNILEIITGENENIKQKIIDNIFSIIQKDDKKEEYLKKLGEINHFTNNKIINTREVCDLYINSIKKNILINIRKILIKYSPNENITIPKKWKLSDKHNEILSNYFTNEELIINKYIQISKKNTDFYNFFSSIHENIENVCNLLNGLSGKERIYDCDKDNLSLSLITSDFILVNIQYIFYNIFLYILDVNKEIGGEYINNRVIIAEFILDMIDILYENHLENDISYEEIQINIGKGFEYEKNKFIKRSDEMNDELREIDQIMKSYKLGTWSKGLKQVWDYSEDDFQEERNEEEQNTKMKLSGKNDDEKMEMLKEKIQKDTLFEMDNVQEVANDYDNYDEGDDDTLDNLYHNQ